MAAAFGSRASQLNCASTVPDRDRNAMRQKIVRSMVPLRSSSAPDSRIGEAILPDSEPTNKAFGHKTYKTFAKSWHISSLPTRSLMMIAPSRGMAAIIAEPEKKPHEPVRRALAITIDEQLANAVGAD